MGRLDGKIAFITGAARGQCRSHAVRLAKEGADIIAVDICRQLDSVPYPLATLDDLAQTAEQVKALNRRVHTEVADVRDETALRSTFDAGVAALGPVDIVLANAGIFSLSLNELERGVAGCAQRRSYGRISYDRGRSPLNDRRQTRRSDRDHELDCWSEWYRGCVPWRTWICRGETRRGWTGAGLRQQSWGILDPGPHHPPDRGEDDHDRQRLRT